MIFHENHLLADDSGVISYLNFCRKVGKMSQNMSSAAVVIGALRVKGPSCHVRPSRTQTSLRILQESSMRNKGPKGFTDGILRR